MPLFVYVSEKHLFETLDKTIIMSTNEDGQRVRVHTVDTEQVNDLSQGKVPSRKSSRSSANMLKVDHSALNT